MTEHPRPAALRDLVGRTRDALEDEQAILEHLSRCDACFQLYDELWAEALADLPELADAFLDPAVGQRLEGRLFRRIHLARLGTASSWLATEGFLRVLIGLLLPIVNPRPTPGARARGENR